MKNLEKFQKNKTSFSSIGETNNGLTHVVKYRTTHNPVWDCEDSRISEYQDYKGRGQGGNSESCTKYYC